MNNIRLRITANDACIFDMSLDVDPAGAAYHAQQQVDIHSWANPDAHVVGELTGTQGERHLLYPTGGAS